MNYTDRYYYDLAVQEEMNRLLARMRLKQFLFEYNQKEYDKMLDVQIDEMRGQE